MPMHMTPEQRAAFDLVVERGYLLRLENTDGWFAAADRPPEDLVEAWDAPDVASEDAYALIDAGLVKEQRRYLLDGGTLIWAYTPIVEQARHAEGGAEAANAE